jgi:hypothetical protein
MLICGATANSYAAIYYVDNAANGANNGTSWTNAWESFDDISWGSIGSGDTIYISGGSTSKTYTDSLDLPSGKDNVTITKGVDAGHNGEVILDGGGITINGRGSVSSGIYISYITFQDCNRGIYGTGENSGGMQNITVDHCRFINFRRAGVFFEGNGNVAGNTNIVVKNSYFNDADEDVYTRQSDGIYVQYLSDFTADHNTIILDNNYSSGDLHSDNIQAFWVDDITYSNNILVQKSNKGLGTQMLFAEAGNGTHYYINNVLYRDCPNALDWAFRLKRSSGGTYVARVYGNSYIGYGKILGADGPAIIKNNILYRLNSATYYSTGSGSTVSNNITTASNPGYLDTSYSRFDLHLQSDSSAIDAGADLGASFNYDIEGTKRPQGEAWDIGAYQLSAGEGGNRPSAPSNLRLISN